MSKTTEAIGRLERAVARLEKATVRLGDGEKKRNGAFAAMKADYAQLVATTETVAAVSAWISEIS